jgi:hypothetical protein
MAMVLRISVNLADAERVTRKSIIGEFDVEKNQCVITSITDGKEIIEALQAYLAESHTHPLPSDLQSIAQATTDRDFTTESAPWLSYLMFASNSIEGLDISRGVIGLAFTGFGDYEKFWEGPFVRFAIGSGPYRV